MVKYCTGNYTSFKYDVKTYEFVNFDEEEAAYAAKALGQNDRYAYTG
jgi:hypothetical protein